MTLNGKKSKISKWIYVKVSLIKKIIARGVEYGRTDLNEIK